MARTRWPYHWTIAHVVASCVVTAGAFLPWIAIDTAAEAAPGVAPSSMVALRQSLPLLLIPVFPVLLWARSFDVPWLGAAGARICAGGVTVAAGLSVLGEYPPGQSPFYATTGVYVTIAGGLALATIAALESTVRVDSAGDRTSDAENVS
ncbi:hypothetical protein [Haloarchaeobius sp. TZWWS8]|uniref:hypothetical protein n=1 Tax=Haloarchaeobius sp. TZWWS8 TaxID=3446121 RepID=UPI003EBB4CB3